MTGIGSNLQTQPSRGVRVQYRPEYFSCYKEHIEPTALGSVLRLQLHKALVPVYQAVPIAFLTVSSKYLQLLQG